MKLWNYILFEIFGLKYLHAQKIVKYNSCPHVSRDQRNWFLIIEISGIIRVSHHLGLTKMFLLKLSSSSLFDLGFAFRKGNIHNEMTLFLRLMVRILQIDYSCFIQIEKGKEFVDILKCNSICAHFSFPHILTFSSTTNLLSRSQMIWYAS